MIDKTKVDLACGDRKKEGYFGIDVVAIEGVDLVHDLNVYPWPLEDNSVDKINCSHYLEHIKHEDYTTTLKTILKETNSFEEFKEKTLKLENQQDGLIKFMDEIYRILKPGGKATIQVPYLTSTRSFGDPTHVRYMHDVSFYYFSKDWRVTNKIDHYGIKSDFDVLFSYVIDEELLLKSEFVRSKAFKENWNAISDLIVDLIKI